MVKRINISQLRSRLRQIEQKRKRAIDEHNRGVRKYNADVRRRRQDVNRAIDKHNREARAHNARVRENRRRIQSALSRLKSQATSPSLRTFSSSVQALHRSYVQFEQRSARAAITPEHQRFLDLAERETANSLDVLGALSEGPFEADSAVTPESLRDNEIGSELSAISMDLDGRWRGALFALDPRNPDAARHFCTSVREILTQILDITAPDADVINQDPDCGRTEEGKPTRRSKIRYHLRRKGIAESDLEDFADKDVGNVVELFGVLNKGTHGAAGRFDITRLYSIKRRVQDGILFLASIVG